MTYKAAKGAIPWRDGDELPEDAIRRARGGSMNEQQNKVIEQAINEMWAELLSGMSIELWKREPPPNDEWENPFVAQLKVRYTGYVKCVGIGSSPEQAIQALYEKWRQDE